MNRSGRLQLRYIEALDLCAVTASAPAGATSPVRIAVSPALDPAPDGDSVPIFSLWCPRAHHAVFLRGRCIDVLTANGVRTERGWLETDVATVREGLAHAATGLRIKTATTGVIRANAAKAVARIEETVEAARASGGLRQLNAAYKLYRRQAECGGGKAIPYSAYLGRFMEGLAVIVAAAAKQFPGGEFGDIGDRRLGQLGIETLAPGSVFNAGGPVASANQNGA